jgi:hypothetical protein
MGCRTAQIEFGGTISEDWFTTLAEAAKLDHSCLENYADNASYEDILNYYYKVAMEGKTAILVVQDACISPFAHLLSVLDIVEASFRMNAISPTDGINCKILSRLQQIPPLRIAPSER